MACCSPNLQCLPVVGWCPSLREFKLLSVFKTCKLIFFLSLLTWCVYTCLKYKWHCEISFEMNDVRSVNRIDELQRTDMSISWMMTAITVKVIWQCGLSLADLSMTTECIIIKCNETSVSSFGCCVWSSPYKWQLIWSQICSAFVSGLVITSQTQKPLWAELFQYV